MIIPKKNYKLRKNIYIICVVMVLAWIGTAFLIYPNLNIIISTFFVDNAFSLEPFEKIFSSEKAMKSLLNSFILAFSLIITVNLLGIFLVLIIEYFDIKGMKILKLGYYSTMIYGGIVLVAGYKFVYGSDGIVTKLVLNAFPTMDPYWFQGYTAVVFVMTFASTSNHMIFLSNAIRKVDYQTIEAAKNMGASTFTILLKVVLPVLLPTIFALTILTFLSGLGAFIAPQVLGGPDFQTITPMILTFSQSIGSRDLAALLAIFLGVASMILLAIMTKVESKGHYMSVSKVKTVVVKQKINNKLANIVVHILAYLLFVIYALPVVLVILFSFTDAYSISTSTISLDRFTLDNYARIFTDVTAYQPFLVSVVYAALTAIIVVGLILFVARLIHKYNNKWTALLEYVFHIPWLLPSTLMALGLIMTYDRPQFLMFNKVLTGTLVILLIAYVISAIPFTLRMLKASFYAIDPSLEDAAKNLGAGNMYTFVRVLLPIVLPSALAILALRFNSTLDEYSLAAFLHHPFLQPLGIVIKNSTNPEAVEDARALTFVYTVILMIISAITLYFIYGRNAKKG
jgi:iron(III) transport system permease protein